MRRLVGSVGVLIVLAMAQTASAAPTEPDLPPGSRRIPDHRPSLLDGCSRADRTLVARRISDAIQLGAPTYNRGDFLGCYQIYERTAREIEGALPASCDGPRRALRDGRQVAATRPTPAAQAWAMRDAFDGLMSVIERAPR